MLLDLHIFGEDREKNVSGIFSLSAFFNQCKEMTRDGKVCMWQELYVIRVNLSNAEK